MGLLAFLNDIVRNNTLSPARVANALDAGKVYSATGTDTYAVTIGLGLTGYNTGDTYRVKIVNTNATTTPTLNVTGASALGAKSIKDNAGNDLAAGDLKANGVYDFVYDGTNLRVMNLGGAGGGGTWGSITGTLSSQTDLQTALDAKAALASPTFTGTVTTPAAILSSETASRVAIIDGSKNIKSADTATYPSLTELAYVKGVTSAIQTQIDAITTGQKVLQIPFSDQTSTITAGTAKKTFRMPFAMTLTAVRASLKTGQTSGNIFTIDINESGTTILSTKLTIDNTEKTSTTAATAAVISDSSLADDAEITIDVDQIGDGTAIGGIVTLIGN